MRSKLTSMLSRYEMEHIVFTNDGKPVVYCEIYHNGSWMFQYWELDKIFDSPRKAKHGIKNMLSNKYCRVFNLSKYKGDYVKWSMDRYQSSLWQSWENNIWRFRKDGTV